MAKVTKNSSLLTIIIATAAILYFAYNSRGTQKGSGTNNDAASLESIKPDIKKQVEVLGELSPPAIENQQQNINPTNTNSTPTNHQLENNIPEINQVGFDINNLPEELPEDLREQLKNPPPLPDDLKAQLEAPPPPIPPDIEEALKLPPRESASTK